MSISFTKCGTSSFSPEVLMLQAVYQYKISLSSDTRFESAAKEVCKDFITVSSCRFFSSKCLGLLSSIDSYCPMWYLIQKAGVDKACTSSQPGAYLPCLIEHAYNMGDESEQHTPCYKFLNKMEMVVFR